MIPLRFRLKDTDPMPFGKHKGTAMANVPAEYLVWIYDNKKTSPTVKMYIQENLEDLRK